MKKLFILFLVILFVPTIAFAYETDSYKANLSNFTQEAEHTFLDNDNADSGITITVGEHKMPTSLISYEDIYNESSINDLQNALTQQFQISLNTTCSPSIACIDKFSNYNSFYFHYEIEILEDVFYYMWIYEIFSDNYVYCIMINSPDYDYINTINAKTFINSFEIKDTTNICTPTVKNETVPTTDNAITTTSEYQYPYADYTLKDWVSNILFTAIIYLFFPILIKLGRKKGFKSSIAFWISLANFLIIKLFLSLLFETEFNLYSAWWYLFIGQAILAEFELTEKDIEKKRENDDKIY